MQRFARTERRRWFKPKHYSNSYTPDFAFVYQQNSSVILECYDDEKKCWVMLPYCDFPIIKCAVTVLPVLGLTSHHDVRSSLHLKSVFRRPGEEYFSHNSSTYTRVFVWLFVTFHFIAQVNREAFNLSI